MDLKGKTALITGSSRGVGQQIAQGLARMGCHIIVHGRTEDSCTQTLEILKDFEIKTYCVYGELSDEAQINQLIDQVQSLEVPIDILYNNAAIMAPYHNDIWEHSLDDWMSSFMVNVYAMYRMCAAIVPQMLKNDFGRIINVTSGIEGEPQLAPYAASKAAVNKLTKDLSSQLTGSNVKINMLDPGWLRTDLGGPSANNAVEDVLPGALAPAIIENDGPNGELFRALG